MGLLDIWKKEVPVQTHGGYIGAHNLEEWWKSTFTQEEREYINGRFKPMGQSANTLIEGDHSGTHESTFNFLTVRDGFSLLGEQINRT